MSASLDFPALDFSPIASTSALPSDHNSATSDSASAPATAVDPPAEAAPKSWSELGVSPFLVKAMAAMSIRHPTAVQQACIPPILAGKSTPTATGLALALLTGRVLTVVWVVWFGCAGSDCIGSAQTGSGKTIAFALPIMQQLAKDPYGLFAVVLTPTRELAFQISEQFRVLGAAVNLHSTVIVGGMDMQTQAIELRKRPHVIIATPGRLCDLIRSNQNEWSLGRAKFLVLDEADRLLTPTFAPELAFLLDQLPAPDTRQTLLFTATLTDPVLALQRKTPAPGSAKPPPFLHVSRELITTPAGLRQHYIFVPSRVREVYLTYLLLNLANLTDSAPLNKRAKSPEPEQERRRHSKKTHRPSDEEEPVPELPQTILFVPHTRTAALFSSLLSQLPVPIPNVALHSQMSQPARLKALSEFRRQKVPLLIATDVGSRGLDIPEVAVVVNWEVPRVADDYVHRVGRTARAGRRGVAVTCVTEGDVELVQVLEERINTQLTELELPEAPVLELLNSVSMAKRMANMALHSDGFGKRQDTNKKKAGLDVRQGEGPAKAGGATARVVKTGAKKAGAKGKVGVGAKPKKGKPVA